MDLDLVFVVDETGSMGNWIESVQREIQNIINDITKNKNCKSFHVGVVSFRDHPPQDSSFVSKQIDLVNTSIKKEKKKLIDYIKGMRASGGGDCPESLIPALYDLCRISWRESSNRVAVVITDAPRKLKILLIFVLAHGVGYGGDGFPGGDPCNIPPAEIIDSLKEIGVVTHGVTCGSNQSTKKFLEIIAKGANGICIDINKSREIGKIISNCSIDSFDRYILRDKILDVIKEKEKDLVVINNENDRVEKLVLVLKEKGLKRESFKGLDRTTEDIKKDDLLSIFRLIRKKIYLEKGHPVHKMFPSIGIVNLRRKAGLYSKDNLPVPLFKIEIDIDLIEKSFSIVKINQSFVNLNDSPIEAKYEFPIINPSAVVNYFSAIVEGKRYVGKCMEKEKAKEVYEDSIASGKGAFLFEESETKQNIFEISLGNVSPKKEVTININVLEELIRVDEKTLKFTFPTIYAPQSFSLKEKTYQLSININAGDFADQLTSPSHKFEKKGKILKILDIERGLKNNLILLLNRKEKEKFIVEEADKFGHAVFYPFTPIFKSLPLKDIKDKKRILVLLDYSSSMVENKKLLEKGMISIGKHLSKFKASQFNCVAFSTAKEVLNQSYLSIDEKNLKRYEGFVKDLLKKDPSGGSELQGTLEDIFKNRYTKTEILGNNLVRVLTKVYNRVVMKEKPTVVILLTDGVYKLETEIASIIANNEVPFYCLGLGPRINIPFLNRIKKVSEGSTEFCTDSNQIELALERHFKRIFQPFTIEKGLKNFDFEDVVVTGQTYSIFTFWDGKEKLEIKGKNNEGKEYVFPLDFDAKDIKKGKTIHTLTARHVINSLTKRIITRCTTTIIWFNATSIC